jgi:hypothetical protein
MIRFAACLSVLFALSAPSRAEPAKEEMGLPLAFHEDFSSGEKALARFEFTDPAVWKLDTDNGRNVLSLFKKVGSYKPPVRSPFTIAWIKDLRIAGPFVLEARLRSTIPDYNHRDLCLFFGRQDASHFFYVHLGKKADPNAHNIFLVDGAPRKNIAKTVTPGTPWDDAYHTVRIVRKEGGAIEVFWDGRSIMTAESKAFPDGGLGVGSFDDIGHFAEVTVWGKAAAAGSRE